MPAELTVTLDAVNAEPERGEVIRYLGYPAGAAPNGDVLRRVDAICGELRGRLHGGGTYSIYAVARQERRRIELRGAGFSGKIGEYLAGSRRVAAFLATAGPEIVRMAEEAMARLDTLRGLVYSAYGSALAEAVVARLVADIASHGLAGEALTMRYSPGYCGISLAQQKTLFRLVDAGRIGVELLPTLIMKPLKSVSGLVGIGPREAVEAFANPCDRCPLSDCRMRR